MRNWKLTDPPKDIDPRLYNLFKQIGSFMGQAQAAFAKISRAETTDSSSTTTVVTSVIAGATVFEGTTASSPVVAIRHTVAPVSSNTLEVRARSGQTGRLLKFENETGGELSYIRPSDGAFVGPIVPTGNDDHTDSLFRILGSADATKKVALEVDGITTATTRTLTVPDVSGTILLTVGGTNGQVIGSGAHTGGTASALVIEGPLMFGDALSGVNFTSGRALDIRHATANNTIFINVGPTITGLTGTASGTLTALQIALSGTPAYTLGSFTARGFFFTSSVTVPSSVTLTEALGGLFQVTPTVSGTGAITKLTGLRVIASAPSITAAVPTIYALDLQLSSRVATGTNASHIVLGAAAAWSGVVTNYFGIDFGTTAVAASATNFTGIRIPAVTGPSGTLLGLDSGTQCRISRLRLGVGGASAHLLEFDAGTTTSAPLRLTSGTNLTSPLAGVIEFNTDDFFATITTGPARKAFVLDDGTRLTAGRVPFATTNGRLTDDADLTFAVDTLTVTKIAAHSVTGLLTLADVDVALGTTTGTKIGTATTQKLGFWNTAPNVQPTTAIAAATFVANSSLIFDDTATFDGYTIGKVVAALRRAGILA